MSELLWSKWWFSSIDSSSEEPDDSLRFARSSPLPTQEPKTIEELLRDGWEIFKAYPVGFIAFTLLVMLVQGAIGGVSPFLMGGGWMEYEDTFTGSFVQVFLSYAIGIPLSAGYYVVALKILRGELVAFEDFFGGFRFWFPIIIASIMVTLIVTIGFILLIIPGIYLAVAYTLVIPVIIDRQPPVWEALEMSRRAITQRWFTVFFLLILLAIINLLGFFALCIGILITIPLSYCTLAALYRDLIGLKG